MNLTSISHLRLVLIVGLLALATLATGLLVLGRVRGTQSTAAEPTRAQVVPAFSGSKLAPAPATAPAPAKAARKARPAPARKAKVDPAVTAALRAGLPVQVARAFARHDVVVLVLHAPESRLDRMTLAEAAAGARRAGAGFVAVGVTSARNSVLTRLTEKVGGVVDTPTTLVLSRPGDVQVQLTGFADEATVAQAALTARS